MTFDPKSVEVACVTLSKTNCVQVPWKYIEVYGYSDLFFSKTWTRGHWPLDDIWPHICWGHMCHFILRIIVSIHQCMWIQRSVLQNIVHSTYYVHKYVGPPTYNTYYVQNEWSESLSLWTSLGETTNYESRLLTRSHTLAIIVILDLIPCEFRTSMSKSYVKNITDHVSKTSAKRSITLNDL